MRARGASGRNTLDLILDGSTPENNADALRVEALGVTDAHDAAASQDETVGTSSMPTLGTPSA